MSLWVSVTPARQNVAMDNQVRVPEVSRADFAELARLLATIGRANGLNVPGFRSPPRVAGARRTIRLLESGDAIVSVDLRGRQREEVVIDLIEGMIRTNRLEGIAAEGWRVALRELVFRDRPTSWPRPRSAA